MDENSHSFSFHSSEGCRTEILLVLRFSLASMNCLGRGSQRPSVVFDWLIILSKFNWLTLTSISHIVFHVLACQVSLYFKPA
jgi:hypothetical protein